MNCKMKKALITGVTGQDGSYLMNFFREGIGGSRDKKTIK